MKRLGILILATDLAGLLVLACAPSNGSACEVARNKTVDAMTKVCGEGGYANSKFCRRCVDAGYFSTTGASVCQCRNLTFDEDSCSYQNVDDTRATVRSAISWADSVCAEFTPPAAIAPLEDAGDASSSPKDVGSQDTLPDGAPLDAEVSD